MVSWLVQWNLLKTQPNSSIGHIFLFTGNFYVAFSFLVRGNVALEMFRRALLPSFWFISLDSGYESITLQVYSFSRYSLNDLH